MRDPSSTFLSSSYEKGKAVSVSWINQSAGTPMLKAFAEDPAKAGRCRFAQRYSHVGLLEIEPLDTDDSWEDTSPPHQSGVIPASIGRFYCPSEIGASRQLQLLGGFLLSSLLNRQ